MKNKLKISENTVIHCPTEELANEVLSIADKLGYKSMTGYKYTGINCWYVEKENTCYDLTRGFYDSLHYYKSQGKIVIMAEEFIKLHKNNNMETYIVKQEDLIGEIKGLPIEIVQRMVDCHIINFIDEDDSNAEWLLKQSFTEAFLPELPKKVTDIKITIAIPTDTILKMNSIKVSYNEEPNEVILTADKENIYKPRVGDYVTILLANTPIKAIITGISDSTHLTYIRVSADNGYDVDECYNPLAKINPATPEEKQEIDTILSYWNVMWNPTKYKLEQKRWRAEHLRVYYYITGEGKVSKTVEGNYSWNNEDYQFGNYFRTEQQAKDKAEQLKKLFK